MPSIIIPNIKHKFFYPILGGSVSFNKKMLQATVKCNPASYSLAKAL